MTESAAAHRPAHLPPIFRSQPPWLLPALAVTVLAALVLYTYNIGYSGLSTYYAAGAKAMSESPRAFFFGALNPSATTTLDKLSGFLLPQAISAKLFGFSAWALSLPQAIEGAITVIASYAIGARWRGPRFGLALAVLMAFTPMLAAMFGRPMEDGMLTMCTVLAFAALQRGILAKRIGWLVLSMMWVAIGFQAKMMQAWLIVPALALAWILGTDWTIRRRVLTAVGAGALLIALSLSWMTAIQLVPAGQRPYVDGSTNNNIFSMVFGYNGFDRILRGSIPGALAQLDSSQSSATNTTATSMAGHSVFKFLLPEFTTQIGWLLPLAVCGIVFELLALRSRRDGDRAALATGVGLVTWLVIPALVLSLAFVPHATYFAELALPLNALALTACQRFYRLYRDATDGWFYALPAAVLLQTVWIVLVLLEAAPRMRFLIAPVVLLGLLATVALTLRRGRLSPLARRAALLAAIAAVLITPVAWSLCVLGPGGGGSASDAFAGPRLGGTTAHAAAANAHTKQPLLRRPFSAPSSPKLDRAQRSLLSYVVARNGSRTWLFATDSMPIAVNFLLDTPHDVLPLGGFSRYAPDPAASQTLALLHSGAVRYVLLNGEDVASLSPNTSVDAVRDWVTANCQPVLTGRYHVKSRLSQTLYDCSAG